MTTGISTVDVSTLNQWLNADEVILVDVREESEFVENSIKGAILISLSVFDPENIPQTPNKKIVFQCRSGKRSEHACSVFLQEYPHSQAYNLEGGILAWQASNFPVCSGFQNY
jgi:rhodanese-related sulfurtransferase